MTVAILSFTASEEEISSGIPETVTIESSLPATVYYTLDGTEPTEDSTIYVDPVALPTGFNSVILSAFAIDSDGYQGPTLEQTFAPDTTDISRGRNTGLEGIVIDRVGEGDDVILGYDADSDPVRFLDLDPITLDIVKSPSELEDTRVIIASPSETPSYYDDDFEETSTPEVAQFFNPQARVIVIDNRINNEVSLVPRVWGSLSDPYKEAGGKRILGSSQDACYISGGFVKRFYSAKTQTMVSYHFDHNNTRWIQNIQQLPTNIPNINYSGFSSFPFVIPWIARGRPSSF